MQAIKPLFLQIKAEYQEFTGALTPPLLPATGTLLGLGDPSVQLALSAYKVCVQPHASRSRAD